mmetsp:Transcript_95540/g.248788  ORF Transcript_95540/g.248788 Transcript_95540/m.248788 type:complete len:219 (+) Transcript_95540:150-806(+)
MLVRTPFQEWESATFRKPRAPWKHSPVTRSAYADFRKEQLLPSTMLFTGPVISSATRFFRLTEIASCLATSTSSTRVNTLRRRVSQSWTYCLNSASVQVTCFLVTEAPPFVRQSPVYPVSASPAMSFRSQSFPAASWKISQRYVAALMSSALRSINRLASSHASSQVFTPLTMQSVGQESHTTCPVHTAAGVVGVDVPPLFNDNRLASSVLIPYIVSP